MKFIFAVLGLLLIAGCGGISALPDEFNRERADGKVPVKVELSEQ